MLDDVLERLKPVQPSRIDAEPLSLSVWEAAQRLRGRRGLVLLESTLSGSTGGRFSYVAACPAMTLSARGRRIEVRDSQGSRTVIGSPWDVWARLTGHPVTDPRPELPPFQGGWIGYFGYDLGRHLERLPSRAVDDLGLPDLQAGVYDWVIAEDHQRGQTWLIHSGRPAVSIDWLRRLVNEPSAVGRGPDPGGSVPGDGSTDGRSIALADPWPRARVSPPRFRSGIGRAAYLAAVRRAKEYIRAGDIYQVNLSHRLTAGWTGDPWDVYTRLRQVAPVPYAAYLAVPGGAVLSASPECFLRVAGDRVETRPIKGTAARGATPEEDQAAAAALTRSAKDLAENLMIVDLLRNDLGRVCATGSVEAPELFALEQYSHVWHLVSTVTGRLHPDRGPVDLLRACFPGGSVTGCPKIRAMEIIEELEPVRRGVYCGAIGYLGFDGSLQTSIVIRTLIASAGRLHLQVGGAVVADSDPEQEYAETLAKARSCLTALDGELIEW